MVRFKPQVYYVFEDSPRGSSFFLKHFCVGGYQQMQLGWFFRWVLSVMRLGFPTRYRHELHGSDDFWWMNRWCGPQVCATPTVRSQTSLSVETTKRPMSRVGGGASRYGGTPMGSRPSVFITRFHSFQGISRFRVILELVLRWRIDIFFLHKGVSPCSTTPSLESEDSFITPCGIVKYQDTPQI